MKKTLFSFILIGILCSSLPAYAEEKTSGVVSTASEVESWLKEDLTGTSTKTETSTTTATTTATVTSTSTSTSTDTSSSSSKDTTSATNPFSEDKPVNATITVEGPSIIDVDTAKAAGITAIANGYPKDGTVSGVEGTTLRLRSWPWGNVIGNYTNGTSVKVLGESGEFYLVDVNGTQGYMHKNYITTPDKAGSGVDPYYPGDTRSGGALSKEDGVKASKDGA